MGSVAAPPLAGPWAAWSRRSANAQAAQVLLPPLVVFVVVRSLLSLLFLHHGFDPSEAASWARWDSSHYLSIADHGYEWFSCPSPPDSDGWCGNTLFFPLYPGLIAALHWVGFSLATAGVLLSAIFSAVILVGLWILMGARLTIANVMALMFAAIFPGFVYYHALFPVSATLACLVAALVLLDRRHYLAAGAAGALAAAFYPPAALFAAVAALWCLSGSGRLRIRVGHAAAVAGPVAAGVLLALLVQAIQVGEWGTYFRAQAAYGHGLHNPLATLWTAMTDQKTMAPGALGNGQTAWEAWYLWVPRLQAVFVTVLVVGVFVVFWRGHRDRQAQLIAAYVLVFWIGLLAVGPDLARYRADALLLPAVALLRHLPRSAQLGLIAGAVGVGWYVSSLFLWGVLM